MVLRRAYVCPTNNSLQTLLSEVIVSPFLKKSCIIVLQFCNTQVTPSANDVNLQFFNTQVKTSANDVNLQFLTPR